MPKKGKAIYRRPAGPSLPAKMKKAVKKEVRKEERQMHGRASGAPVSYSRVIRGVGRPIKGLGQRVKGRGRGGPVNGRGSTFKRHRFSGTDLIAPAVTNSTTAGQVAYQTFCSPTQLPSPRLNILAQLYERFQFVRLKFDYIPAVATSVAGNMTMHYDNDPLDQMTNVSAATNLQTAMAHKKAVEFAVWERKSSSINPTLRGESEYYVDQTNPVSRQNCQGLFCVLSGPACTGVVAGSIVCHWTVDMWVEVVEQNSSASAGSALTAEFYARNGAVVTATNLNLIAPLVSTYDGPGSVTIGQPILPDLGSLPQVTITNPNPNTTLFSGTGGGSFLFTQVFLTSGSDTPGSAALFSTFTTGTVSNVTVNSNQVQMGSANGSMLATCVWTIGTGSSWTIALQYPSSAAGGWGQNSKWRRSWLMKLSGFTSRPPEKESRTRGEDEKLKSSILDEVKMLLNGKGEKRLADVLPADWRDEKERGYAFVEEPMRPPPLRPVRTPGRQGGPNAEEIKVRPVTPVASVRAAVRAAELANRRIDGILNYPDLYFERRARGADASEGIPMSQEERERRKKYFSYQDHYKWFGEEPDEYGLHAMEIEGE